MKCKDGGECGTGGYCENCPAQGASRAEGANSNAGLCLEPKRMNSMKIIIEGKLTAGYYNAMEAGNPVFIDGEPVDEKIKDALRERGVSDNFCYSPFENSGDVHHPLIGHRVRLTLEIDEA